MIQARRTISPRMNGSHDAVRATHTPLIGAWLLLRTGTRVAMFVATCCAIAKTPDFIDFLVLRFCVALSCGAQQGGGKSGQAQHGASVALSCRRSGWVFTISNGRWHCPKQRQRPPRPRGSLPWPPWTLRGMGVSATSRTTNVQPVGNVLTNIGTTGNLHTISNYVSPPYASSRSSNEPEKLRVGGVTK